MAEERSPHNKSQPSEIRFEESLSVRLDEQVCELRGEFFDRLIQFLDGETWAGRDEIPLRDLLGGAALAAVLKIIGASGQSPVSHDTFRRILDHYQSDGIPTEDNGVVEEFRSADTWYRLRTPLDSESEQRAHDAWEFRVQEFSPRFIGRGATCEEAIANWRSAVHTSFQSLVRLRPFRMTDEQKDEWSLLQRLIDVEHYWRTAPLTLREIGFVSLASGADRRITWLDGQRVEEVGLDRMPAEFAAFRQGDWFEAVVQREPETYGLRCVLHVRKTDPLHRMTEEELKQWYDSLPTTDSLPESGSDWATL